MPVSFHPAADPWVSRPVSCVSFPPSTPLVQDTPQGGVLHWCLQDTEDTKTPKGEGAAGTPARQPPRGEPGTPGVPRCPTRRGPHRCDYDLDHDGETVDGAPKLDHRLPKPTPITAPAPVSQGDPSRAECKSHHAFGHRRVIVHLHATRPGLEGVRHRRSREPAMRGSHGAGAHGSELTRVGNPEARPPTLSRREPPESHPGVDEAPGKSSLKLPTISPWHAVDQGLITTFQSRFDSAIYRHCSRMPFAAARMPQDSALAARACRGTSGGQSC